MIITYYVQVLDEEVCCSCQRREIVWFHRIPVYGPHKIHLSHQLTWRLYECVFVMPGVQVPSLQVSTIDKISIIYMLLITQGDLNLYTLVTPLLLNNIKLKFLLYIVYNYLNYMSHVKKMLAVKSSDSFTQKEHFCKS